MTHNAVFHRACELVESGYSVIPIKPDGSKSPAVKEWKHFQTRTPTADDDELTTMFDRDVGLAVIGGAVSGNLEVIDFDQPGLFERFKPLIDGIQPGLLDRLPQHSTPRPGTHLFLKSVSGGPCQALASTVVDGKRTKLIETKAEGGYVLLPPSPGTCHPTGNQYHHISGPPLELVETVSPDERELLFSIARSFGDAPQPTPETKNGNLDGVFSERRHNAGELSPGDDFNRRAKWDDILCPHGWSIAHSAADVTHWTRPGKERGVSATTGLRAKQSGNELLVVFSSNAHPFTIANGVSESFTKFGAFAILNHGGDFKTATKALAQQGYGSSRTCDPNSTGPNDSPEPTITVHTVRNLLTAYPRLRPPVIHGLLREGETLNIIAAPKVGKSWLATDVALSLATGRPWLGLYDVEPGEVLILDNELHGETSANRIPRVADARGIALNDYGDRVHVANLRGHNLPITKLSVVLNRFEPGRLKVVIVDAWYRAIPVGMDENDNGAIAGLYNLIDQFALKLGCSFILIHHSTKGSQSGKAVTDMGAGAGSQARATDSHLVLRPHAQDGAVVLDAAVRSWQPIQPRVLAWTFPVFDPVEDLDPTDLKPDRPPRRKPPKEKADDEPPKPPAWTLERFAAEIVGPKPKSRSLIMAQASQAGIPDNKAEKLFLLAVGAELIHSWPTADKRKREYATVKPPLADYPS